MSTAQTVITQALKELGVVAAGETASSEDTADALTRLNWMISNLEVKGVDVGIPTLALADEIDLPDGHERTIMAMLAVDLAPSYEAEPKALTLRVAEEGLQVLKASFADPGVLRSDTALTRRSRVRRFR